MSLSLRAQFFLDSSATVEEAVQQIDRLGIDRRIEASALAKRRLAGARGHPKDALVGATTRLQEVRLCPSWTK